MIAGDTFESISRKVYGTEQRSGWIVRSNPGVTEPLTVGIALAIPDIPEAPKDAVANIPANDIDEVAVRIDGQRFRFWENIRVTRTIDSMAKIEFSAPFDHTAPGFKETFRPVSYKPLSVTIGGEPFFSGTMVSLVPVIAPENKTISVSGYSKPGVLNDCPPPASAFPLEFNGQKLDAISERIAGFFGIGVEFKDDPGAVFPRVACDAGRKALAFLIELAKQRNLIISNDASGNVLFWRSVEGGSPVARLRQGESPLVSVSPQFSPQEYYSQITGIEPIIAGLKGQQHTAKNTFLEGVIRPLTFNTPDTAGADITAAVSAKMGRMFGNVATYTIGVDTWRDFSGNLWAPNTTLKLLAPDAMVYNEYEFLIREVELSRDRASKIATLQLVFPGSFSGKIPESLPWD